MTAQGDSVLALESDVGGSTGKSFKMDGHGYFLSDDNHGLVDMADACTVIIWYYDEDITDARGTLFQKDGTTLTAGEQEVMIHMGE